MSPVCVVTAEGPTNVSVVLFVLNTAYKLTCVEYCKFAVKRGGYVAFSKVAIYKKSNYMNTRGSQHRFGQLNQITVSKDQTSVNIGPGNRWEAVYQGLDARNLTSSGGGASTVGMSGLTLGGGFFFSPRSGLIWYVHLLSRMRLERPVLRATRRFYRGKKHEFFENGSSLGVYLEEATLNP